MPETPDREPDLSRLLDSLQTLSARFDELAGRLATAGVDRLRDGLLPDLCVLDDCRLAAVEYAEVEAAAVAAGLPPGRGLGEMIAALRDRVTSIRWERFRAEASPLLDEIGRITHTAGTLPQYLADALRVAARIGDEIDTAPAGTDPADWEPRLQPFRDLWRLLTDPESLPEADADAALTGVEEAFGRPMMSAVATRKLAVSRRTAVDLGEPDGLPLPGPSAPPAHDDVAAEHRPSISASLPERVEGGMAHADEPATETPAVVAVVPSAVEFAEASPGQRGGDATTVEPAAGDAPGVACDESDEVPVCGGLRSGAATSLPSSGEPRERSPGLPAGVDEPTVRTAVWELLGSGRAGLAYHLSECWAGLGPGETPALFRAAALAPHVRSSFGDVVDEFRGCVADLGPVAGPVALQDETSVARRLVLFGLSLRPALLAPAAGAISVLQAIKSLDLLYPGVGRVRAAVCDFGEANVELRVCLETTWVAASGGP